MLFDLHTLSYIPILGQSLPCDGGFICLGGSDTPRPSDGIKGYICPEGHYCPRQALEEYECLKGTYAPGPGYDVCEPCPEGKMIGWN